LGTYAKIGVKRHHGGGSKNGHNIGESKEIEREVLSKARGKKTKRGSKLIHKEDKESAPKNPKGLVKE